MREGEVERERERERERGREGERESQINTFSFISRLTSPRYSR